MSRRDISIYGLIQRQFLNEAKLRFLSYVQRAIAHLNATRGYVDLIRSNHPVASMADRVVIPAVGCAFRAAAKSAFPFFVSASRRVLAARVRHSKTLYIYLLTTRVLHKSIIK